MNMCNYLPALDFFHHRSVLAAVLGLCAFSGNAIQPGDVDLTFDPGSAVDGNVNAIIVLTNGQVLIGGSFSAAGGAFRGGVARLNADGTTDLTFMNGQAGFSGAVESLALQPDGKILAGGEFDQVNGIGRKNIARLNPDGTLDTSFQNGMTGVHVFTDIAQAGITGIIVQPDGKVLIAGHFNSVNGVTRDGLARLNADGSLDNTFSDALAPSGDGDTYGGSGICMALQPDGKIVVGGKIHFWRPGRQWDCIARFNSDGSLDTNFLTGGSGASQFSLTACVVTSIVRQDDGKLLVAGDFTDFNGVPSTNLVRLTPDGDLDSAFNAWPELTRGLQERVLLRVVAEPGGKVVLGGAFGQINGLWHPGITRLNTDGSLDAVFHNGHSGIDDNYGPIAVARQSDGKVLVGGTFFHVNGASRVGVARLNADGSLDNAFENGNGGISSNGLTVVKAVSIQTNGQIVIAGVFAFVGGVTNNCFARLNSTGGLDATFQTGTGIHLRPNQPANSASVGAVVIRPNGKSIIGGGFDSVNGVVRNGVAQLNADGTPDSSFGVSGVLLTNYPGFPDNSGYVTALALQPDGKVIIAGSFNSAEGEDRPSLARLNLDGSVDPNFMNGMSGPAGYNVNALTVQPDGKVLIGGGFLTMNGGVRIGIARLNSNGSLDIPFQAGMSGVRTADGNAGNVSAMALQPDGKVIIAGIFERVNGAARTNIARLNNNGTIDITFQNGMAGAGGGYINSVILQPDGKLIVAGDFTSVNGIERGRLARLNQDGSLDTSFLNGGSFGGGVYPVVYALALQPDGELLVAGTFAGLNGVLRPHLMRLYTSVPRPNLTACGMVSNAFQFYATGPSGQVFAVEVSTDLLHWTSISTDILGSGSLVLKDPGAAAFPNRFYRARLQ